MLKCPKNQFEQIHRIITIPLTMEKMTLSPHVMPYLRISRGLIYIFFYSVHVFFPRREISIRHNWLFARGFSDVFPIRENCARESLPNPSGSARLKFRARANTLKGNLTPPYPPDGKATNFHCEGFAYDVQVDFDFVTHDFAVDVSRFVIRFGGAY